MNAAELEEFFKGLRISREDSKSYAKSLIEVGFDDVQSLLEDVEEIDLMQIEMRTGHIKRVFKCIRSHRGDEKRPVLSSQNQNIIRCKQCQVICTDEFGNDQILSIEFDPNGKALPPASSCSSGKVSSSINRFCFVDPLDGNSKGKESELAEAMQPILGSLDSVDENNLFSEPTNSKQQSTPKLKLKNGLEGKVDKNPYNWTIDDVVLWLKSFDELNSKKYEESFVSNKINGPNLLGITSEADLESLRMNKKQHRLKFLQEVDYLRNMRRQSEIEELDRNTLEFAAQANGEEHLRKRRVTELVLPPSLLEEEDRSSFLSNSLPHLKSLALENSISPVPSIPNKLSLDLNFKTPMITPKASNFKEKRTLYKNEGLYDANTRLSIMANEITPKVNTAQFRNSTPIEKRKSGRSYIKSVQRIKDSAFFDNSPSPEVPNNNAAKSFGSPEFELQLDDELPQELSSNLQLDIKSFDNSQSFEESGNFSAGGTLHIEEFVLKPHGMMNRKEEKSFEKSASWKVLSQMGREHFDNFPSMSSSNRSYDSTERLSKAVQSFKREKESTVLLEEVGRGGGGIVYKALHIPSLRLVAVKVVAVTVEAQAPKGSNVSPIQQIARELRNLHSINSVQLGGVPFPLKSDDGKHSNGKEQRGKEKDMSSDISNGTERKAKGKDMSSDLSSGPELSDSNHSRTSKCNKAQPSKVTSSNSKSLPKTEQLNNKLFEEKSNESSEKTYDSKRQKDESQRNSPTSASSYIVAFHDAYSDPNKGNVCMVMEYMDGGTLQQFVEQSRKADEFTIAVVARSVLKGLAAMHSQNRIHRDIKPSNILLDSKGRVKIGDFGITKELGITASVTSTFTGTLSYMSPERINNKAYSYSSDVWSIGLVIMTIALGKFPLKTEGGYWVIVQAIQEGPPPQLPKGDFAPDLCHFVTCMLQKEPERRLSARELLRHQFLKRFKGAKRAPDAVANNASKSCSLEVAENLMEEVVSYKVHKRLNELEVVPRNDQKILTREPLGLTLSDDGRHFQALSKQLRIQTQALADCYNKLALRVEKDWKSGRNCSHGSKKCFFECSEE